MTLLHDMYTPGTNGTFEETEQQRLDLLEDIDKAQAPSFLRRFRAHLVSRKALKLAQRQEMYPAQSEDLLHRAVAVNPKIEQKAHEVLDQIYATDHPELADSYLNQLPPARAVAHLALEKTVELSLDLSDDDAPTVPIPIILQAAVGTINNEQIEHIPESKLRMEAAWNHRSEQMQEQREARIENASDEEKSESDDAEKLTPEQMKALLFDDDDEIEELVNQARKVAA